MTVRDLTTEEVVLLGQAVAEKIAVEIISNIDEAITQTVLQGKIPFEIAPEVKRQVWIELAILCSGRMKSHGT